MSEEDWGPCPDCSTPLSRANASRLRSGAVAHVGCRARGGFEGALLEEVALGQAAKDRFSTLTAGLPDPGMPEADRKCAGGYARARSEERRVAAAASAGRPNGLLCSVCREPQFDTPNGEVCKNGHGGAEGVPPPPAKKLRRQVSLLAPSPDAAPVPAEAEEVRRGLAAEVARAAAELEADVVLQALHVAGGANGIGVGEVRPPVCPRCLGVDPGEPGGVPDAPHPGPFTPDLCAACDRSTRTGPNIDVRSPGAIPPERGKAAVELGPDGTEVVALPPLAKAGPEPPPAPEPVHMLVPGFPGHTCCGEPVDAPKPAVPPAKARRASRGRPAAPASPGSPATTGTPVATDRSKVTCGDCLELYDDAEALAGRIAELEPEPTEEELEAEALVGERRAEAAARASRSADQAALIEAPHPQPERHPGDLVHLFDGYPDVAQHRASGLSEARCCRTTSIKVGLLTAVPFVAGHPRCCPACAALPQPRGARSYGAFVPAGG